MAKKTWGKQEELGDPRIQMDDTLPFSDRSSQSLSFIIFGVAVVGRHRLVHTQKQGWLITLLLEIRCPHSSLFLKTPVTPADFQTIWCAIWQSIQDTICA